MKNRKIVLMFAMAMVVASVFAQQERHEFEGSVYGMARKQRMK